MPGLIEGASEGIGLGHEFLAHLERARLLLHVIDSSERDLEERWRTIDAELAAYGAGLDDAAAGRRAQQGRPLAGAAGVRRSTTSGSSRVLRVSAATGAGIDELKRALFSSCPAEAVVPTAPADERRARRLPRLSAAAVAAARSASTAPRAASASPGRHRRATELEAILKPAGAREGDEVEIGEEMLEWQ